VFAAVPSVVLIILTLEYGRASPDWASVILPAIVKVCENVLIEIRNTAKRKWTIFIKN
jgi:hypothetical protein